MIPIQNLDDAQRNTIAEALHIIANVIASSAQPAATVQQPVQPDPAAVAAQQQAAQQQAAVAAQQQAAAIAAQQQAAVAAQQQTARQGQLVDPAPGAPAAAAATQGPITMDMLLNRLKALNPQTGGQLKAHAEGIFQKYGSTTGLAGLKNEVLGDVLWEMETLAGQLMAPHGGVQ